MSNLLLSKSRLNTWCTCPEKYRLTYIENIRPEKTPTAMLEGSALHHIVENCLVYGKSIPDMPEAASSEYWQNIQLVETEYKDEEALANAQTKILAEAKGFLAQIGELNTYQMETYFEHPLVNPITGEEEEGIILRGYADLIDQPEKDRIRIIDIKTTAKSPNMEQANRALELTVYAYLMGCQMGFHLEVPVSLLYLVRTKEPKVIWLNAQRSLNDFMELHNTICHIADAIKQGLFWKNQGMQCSWCQHQEICFAKSLAA